MDIPQKRSRVDGDVDQSLADWIRRNDDMLGTDKLTISDLLALPRIKRFNEKVFDQNQRRAVNTGNMFDVDWSKFRSVLEARTTESPRWFIHLREESLLLIHDRTIGEDVEVFVVLEAAEPTLAPRYYMTTSVLPYADPEDRPPRQFHHLSEQKVQWQEVTRDDGSSINAYILRRKALKFGFGGDAPSAGTTAPATATTGFGFGFGNAAATKPTEDSKPTGGFAFGFGTSAPSSASTGPFAFGFGAPKPPSDAAEGPAKTGFGFGSAASAQASEPGKEAPSFGQQPVQIIPEEKIIFNLFSEDSLEEAREEVNEGKRISIENVRLPDLAGVVKLTMDDLDETPEGAAESFIKLKVFPNNNERLIRFDSWMKDVPEMDGELMTTLQESRERILGECLKSDSKYKLMKAKLLPAIIPILQKAKQARDELRNAQLQTLSEVETLMKQRKLLSKSSFVLRKYYPENDKARFNPYGKISGISESGEVVDECYPPLQKTVNPFQAFNNPST